MAEFPPIPGTLEDFWKEFSDDTAIILDGLARRVGRLVLDLVNSFPDPIEMGNAITIFATSIPAIIIEAPVRRHWRNARANVREAAKNRLMRPEDAIEFVEDVLVDTGSILLGISPQTLVEWLLTRAAVWAWHVFKEVKFLMALLRVKNQTDMIKLVKRLFLSRLKFLRVKLIMVLFSVVFYFVARIAGLVLAYRYFAVNDYVLSQDSKRRWTFPSRPQQKRFNLKRGADSDRL